MHASVQVCTCVCARACIMFFYSCVSVTLKEKKMYDTTIIDFSVQNMHHAHLYLYITFYICSTCIYVPVCMYVHCTKYACTHKHNTLHTH